MNELNRLERWTLSHAFLMLTGAIIGIMLVDTWPLVLLGALSFGLLIFLHWNSWKEHGWYGGAPNAITAFRVITYLIVLLMQPDLGMWPTAVIISLVQFTDLLDGYIARKWNLSSLLGAYFDKESDAFYNLSFCMLLFLDGAPIWVFIIGMIRYVYVPVLYFFKPKDQKEKRFPLGVVIAVIIMWGLPIAYVLPAIYQIYLLGVLTALLVFSFGRSFYFMVIS